MLGPYSEEKGYATHEDSRISIDVIKQRVGMERLLAYYGAVLPLKSGDLGEWKSMSCPFHHDRTPSASVNFHQQRFKCHGICDVYGDVVDVVQWREGLTTRQAMEFLLERLG